MNLHRRLQASVLLVFVLILFASVNQATVAQASTSSFDEEFNTTSLDPAWQVVSFTGTRSHGYSLPAGHFDLTSNPGHLRYFVDPMIHMNGFLNGFTTSGPDQWGYSYDPALELRRSFDGTNWDLETATSYFMPSSNGRYFELRVYFGDGGPNTFSAEFGRAADVSQNYGIVQLEHKTGVGLDTLEILASSYPSPTPSDAYYFRLERRGGVLTALWSPDGATWNVGYSVDLGSQLDGLAQQVVIVGHSWFTPANSYGDYDYVRLSPASGCAINAPASVREGMSFTATVNCYGASDVYGFQLGTSSSGDASTSATSYTAGSFVADVDPNYLVGSNTLSNYAVSRNAPAAAASGDFSLGSLPYTASTGLTANGSATLSLDTLLLGDITGAPISIPVTSPTIITILDRLTLNLTVASDGSVQQVRDVTASVDTESRGPQTAPSTSLTFNFIDVIDSSTPTLTADMKSHLACSGPLNLTTSVTDATIHLLAGDVVLNGADLSPEINLYDATAIGLAYGTAGSGEEDVNGDGIVNIFDLIHVGRNYGHAEGVCS